MRAIIFLAGLAMAASWALIWLELPFAGPDISPMALARDGVIVIGADSSWQTWVFVGGFGAAALAGLLALMGRASGVLCTLAGISPVVVGVDAYLRADEFIGQLNLPVAIDFGDVQQTWEVAQDFVRLGLWAYLGGAAILLLAGLALTSAGRR